MSNKYSYFLKVTTPTVIMAATISQHSSSILAPAIVALYVTEL